MSNNTSSLSSGSIGFLGLLTLILITLKLLDKIDISWLWVLAPTWIPLGLLGIILFVVALVSAVLYVIEHYKGK